jgi:hypothetical protein
VRLYGCLSAVSAARDAPHRKRAAAPCNAVLQCACDEEEWLKGEARWRAAGKLGDDCALVNMLIVVERRRVVDAVEVQRVEVERHMLAVVAQLAARRSRARLNRPGEQHGIRTQQQAAKNKMAVRRAWPRGCVS